MGNYRTQSQGPELYKSSTDGSRLPQGYIAILTMDLVRVFLFALFSEKEKVMFEKLFKIQTLVVIMVLIAQFILPIGSAFATSTGSMLPPSNLSFEKPSPEDLKLTWNAVYGASGYNVYEIQEGQLILLGTANTNSFSINDLPEGEYSYTVSTLNGEAETGPSAPVTVDVVYPSMGAPANLTYKIQNGNDLVLNWTAAKYAKEYYIYEVLENGDYKLLTTTTSNGYTNTNAAAGTYTYAVSASNPFFGESALTDTISVELVHPVMGKPENPSFTISNGTDVNLKWNSVPFAKSYNVYQVVDGQKVLKETVTSTNLKLLNQPEGDYTYSVHALSDRFGESEEGSVVELTVSPVVMQAPNASVKIQNFNDINISWESVSLADSYKVYQIVDGEKLLKDTVTKTYVNYQQQASGDYQFEIHSYSSRFGESEESANLIVTVESYELDAPQNGVVIVKNGNDLTLSWDSVINASNYKVYQYIDGNKVMKDTITGTSKTYSNQPEGNYEYEIFAYNPRIGESKDGLQINTVLVHPEVAPPNNIEYMVTNPTSFTLSWEKSEYANSYNVYQILNGEKVLKRSVSGTSISYSNMEAGQYEYKVYSSSSRFGESKVGSLVEVTLDGYVMQAPENLKYTILNGNDIKLEWDSVEYAASYKIYQVVDGEKKLLTTSNRNYATLTNQPAGEYEIVIHSYSYFSSQSPEGAYINFSLVHPVMEKPEGLTALIQNGNDVALSWDPVSYATSYNIYELIDGDEVLKDSVSYSSKPKKTIVNVAEGEHDYVIRSVSTRFGESNEGTEVNVRVDFPEMQKPENLTQTFINGNDISLKWDAANHAKSYNIYQVKNDEKELIKTVTSTSTVLTNMPEGEYHLQVTSFSDRFGESDVASSVEFTLVFPIMQAPEGAYFSINNGNDIILRWDRSTYAKSYNIYQVVDGTKELLRTVTGTSVSFTNMPEGGYHYEVHSYSDRFGESPLSSSIELTMVWPEMQPAVLTGKVFNANNITLSWPQVTWANGYEVYKVAGENRELLYKGKALKYDVHNLTEDTHSFEVVAYSDRFGESPASNMWTENIVYPEMEAPKANIKLLSSTSARISWDFVTYANGYNIYELIDGKPVLVAEKVNNLSYTLNNLSYANHLYYVTSYSNSFGESDSSETVLAKLIIDEEAPVTTSDASTDWTNKTTTVKLSATDNETGVAATYYSLDGTNFVEGTTFTVEHEGIQKVSFYSVDKVGNKENVKTLEVKIDKTKPETTSDLGDGWANSDVEVNLTSTDRMSGVANTFYSVNGSEFAEGTTFTVSGEGIHQVAYYSVDNAENVEEVITETVKIDSEAPVTTSNIEDGWVSGGFKVTLEAVDQLSGVNKTYYSIDGLEFTEGTSVNLPEDGIYEVSYYSTDVAGNKEAIKTEEVKVDNQAPVTSSNIEEKWYQGKVNVEFTATDNLSGVAATYYSINGVDFTEGTSLTIEEKGSYKVSYYSVDNAGNIEEVKTETVKMDSEAPVTTSNIEDKWYQDGLKVTLTATDDFSGIDKTFYSVDGLDFKEGTEFELEADGVYKVSYYSIDKAGNVEEKRTEKVSLDTQAPVTASNIEDKWYQDKVEVKLTATDNLSGVAATYYSINDSAFTKGDSLTIEEKGSYEISYYSVDNAGNIEEVKTQTVNMDSEAPVTASNIEDKWYQDGLKVELNATDDFSGVAQTFYSVDGSDFAEGTEVVLAEDGVYEVSYYSVDRAGNVEEVKKEKVKVDGEAPETTDNASDTWYKTDAEVVLSANDNLSGVQSTYYSFNDSDFIKGSSVTVTDEGVNLIKYYSMDEAGNTEEVKSTEVKIDKTAPTITANVEDEIMLGSKFTISYTAYDGHSGIATEEILLNGVKQKNGDTKFLFKPGVNTLSITVTDHAGWTTTYEKEFVVYIPVCLEVLPKVIKGNKGVFTVKSDLLALFSYLSFDVSQVTLNGVSPKVDNNGLYKQAQKGQFKFEREDFDWKPGKVELEFRAYLENGLLVKGTTIVDVK
jgi:large repetitive protein